MFDWLVSFVLALLIVALAVLLVYNILPIFIYALR